MTLHSELVVKRLNLCISLRMFLFFPEYRSDKLSNIVMMAKEGFAQSYKFHDRWVSCSCSWALSYSSKWIISFKNRLFYLCALIKQTKLTVMIRNGLPIECLSLHFSHVQVMGQFKIYLQQSTLFAWLFWVFFCFFGVYRPTREYFTHMEMFPWLVKGRKFWPL